MPLPPIYLDHNATTPILPEVADAVREASLRFAGNPASQHDFGRQARQALEAARERIGSILGAKTGGMDADRIVFTSGGTEANNLALHGLLPRQARSGLVVSAVEHPSVARTADHLAALGCHVEVLGVDKHGVVLLQQLEELLPNPPPSKVGERPWRRGARGGISGVASTSAHGAETDILNPSPNLSPQGRGMLVSVMLGNNETGVLQPVEQLAALCRPRGVLVHTDAVQVVGKLPVNFRELGVDALTATAHKFHGPLGIGMLLVRHGVQLAPTMQGGFQQAGMRPGTEPVALAIGMCTALELWQREAGARQERMTSLRDRLERSLLAGDPAAVVIGAGAPRLPHTSNIAFTGLDRQSLVMALDLAGVACSTGSACASGSSEPSPALVAMGLPEAVISSSVRLSLGATTTAAEVDEAARRILSVCNRLRQA